MITTINRAIAKKNEENDKGFTLIELLVVILIIGVLAAIAIPAFLNQREGAWKAQVESDLKNAALAVEQYGVNNNGKLPATGPASADGVAADPFKANGFTGTKDVSVDYVLTGNTYTLTGTHAAVEPTTRKIVYSSVSGKLDDTAWKK